MKSGVMKAEERVRPASQQHLLETAEIQFSK